MANEWVRMRLALLRSSQPLRMARYLINAPGFRPWASGSGRAHASVDLVLLAVVGGLLGLWGAANEDSVDGFLCGLGIDDLDRLAGIPAFGRALASVGWASETERNGQRGVLLPDFLKHNTPAASRTPTLERHRRYRERKRAARAERDVADDVVDDATSDVAGDVVGDDREEKSREDRIEDLPPSPRKRGNARRATRWRRVPDGETLTEERRTMATDAGVDASRVDRAWADFTDHDFARPKLDVDATWRKWCRTDADRNPAAGALVTTGPGGRPPSGQFVSAAVKSEQAARRAMEAAHAADAARAIAAGKPTPAITQDAIEGVLL